tara:strand:+ start:916 stop:1431 length:516 start_codon:yes stop_codon:yes gene_type:complete
MKIKKSTLKRIIQEELSRIAERTLPDTLDIDTDAMEFSVEAEPNRPGEEGERRRIKGRLEPYKGKYLPKGIEGEDYFGSSMRSASGQLSAQLRDVINQQMTDAGYEAASVAAATDKMTKGAVMGDALSQLLSLDSKLSDPEDKAILKAAVESILGIKFRFEIPNQLDNQES